MPQRRTQNILDNIMNGSDFKRSEELVKAHTGSDYQVTMVPIDSIHLNKMNTVFNANDTVEDIKLLADSISEPSKLRNPIILNRDDKGRLILIAGERRTKAFLYNRKRVLQKNPLLKSTEWDKIPAFVKNNLSAQEQTVLLYFDNLETRQITEEQRYFAFETLISYCESQSDGVLTAEAKQTIADAFKISKRTVERMKKIRDNAAEEDVRLLNEGKISFSEFKKRTNALIEVQSKRIALRNEILGKRAVPKSYYDEENGSVFYISQTTDPRTEETKYCTYAISAYMNTAIHIPELGEYSNKNLAQVDLDRYASNNLLKEYTGDFSEFKIADKSSSKDSPTVKKEQSSQLTIEDTITSDESSDKSDLEAQEPDTSKESSEETPENEALFDEKEYESSVEKSENEANNAITEPTQSEPEDDELTEEESELYVQEKEQKGEIFHSSGINLNGISVQGPLFAAPNGRVYILSGIEIGKNIGLGKFEIKCYAEEVMKDTVRRIDDI